MTHNRQLRIALTVDAELPVPPKLYGGIERMVDGLARGLVARGHEVVLFANRESRSAGRLIPYIGNSSTSYPSIAANAALIACHCIAGAFDILHSSSRIAFLLPVLPLPLPKLMTYHREITRRSIVRGVRLSRGTLAFSAVGRHMLAGVSDLGRWYTVHNGAPVAFYDFTPAVEPDAPLLFLGRVEHIKGTHVAISLARRTGIPLVIAGNVDDAHRDYFDQQVRPFLDGKTVSYVGPVDDRQKNALIGRSRALLMPVLWEEPFGIVMAEALACGTPVIGLRRGAVPEVVDDGVTGFVCADEDEMAAAIIRLDAISRAECRHQAERFFSEDAMVESYLAIYRELISSSR